MWTKAFWIAAVERSAKTFAQTAVALWPVNSAFNIVDLDVGEIAGLSASAAALSVLTSVASIPLSRGDSPSLVPDAEVEAANA